jgi:hypothetical protein
VFKKSSIGLLLFTSNYIKRTMGKKKIELKLITDKKIRYVSECMF